MNRLTPDAVYLKGEQGKVEESMQEMEAVEALKNEKTEKEVSTLYTPKS